jgi:hypothetical protein
VVPDAPAKERPAAEPERDIDKNWDAYGILRRLLLRGVTCAPAEDERGSSKYGSRIQVDEQSLLRQLSLTDNPIIAIANGSSAR